MVSLIPGLILVLTAVVPSGIVKTTAKALYIDRMIHANVGPALKGMDQAYAKVEHDDSTQAKLLRHRSRVQKRLAEALAVWKVMHTSGCLRRTPDKCLRIAHAVQHAIPGLLAGISRQSQYIENARTREFLDRIRAANTACTALWLRTQSKRLHRLLSHLGVDKVESIPGILKSKAAAGDRSAEVLLDRIKKGIAFSFTPGGLRNPMAGSCIIRRFGALDDPKYPVAIPGPGIVLGWYGGRTRTVRAVTEGMVYSVFKNPGTGLTVVLDHSDGRRSVYSGLDTVAVHEGEMVLEGERLGEVKGKNIPCILFFALEKDGRWIDPQRFIVTGQ